MSQVNYDNIETGALESIRPEALGWQTIGRGAYMFGQLVQRYGQDAFRKHNWAPPNFTEVSEREFATMSDYLRYPLIATTYRQIVADEYGCATGYILEGHLFINALGKGYMIHFDYLKRRARYFIFMFCQHDYTIKQIRLGETEASCNTCGYVRKTEFLSITL